MERRASPHVHPNSRYSHQDTALGPSGPVGPIQGAVLDSLGNVFRFQLRNGVQVGYGSRDFEDTVMGAGTKSLLRHGAFQQALAVGGEFAELANQLRRHLRVAIKLLLASGETFQLHVTRSNHALQNTR